MHDENYLIKSDTLEDIADAIREKKQSQETIAVSDFATEIENLPSGGGSPDDYFLPTIVKGTSSSTGIDNIIIHVPAFNFSDTNSSYMFARLGNVLTIDCSKFDTSRVTKMNDMFVNCRQVVSLDLSNFITSNVTTMQNMFSGCEMLQFLDIRNFTFDSVTNSTYMFARVPTYCEIIVKSETEKTWFADNWPSLTNVKTVAEYEAQ